MGRDVVIVLVFGLFWRWDFLFLFGYFEGECMLEGTS